MKILRILCNDLLGNRRLIRALVLIRKPTGRALPAPSFSGNGKRSRSWPISKCALSFASIRKRFFSSLLIRVQSPSIRCRIHEIRRRNTGACTEYCLPRSLPAFLWLINNSSSLRAGQKFLIARAQSTKKKTHLC